MLGCPGARLGVVGLVLASVMAGACQRESSQLLAEGPGPGRRPRAEYEPTRAVLFATGWQLTSCQNKDGDERFRAAACLRAEEYRKLYDAVIKDQPKLSYFIYTRDKNVLTKTSDYDAWLPRVEEWRKTGADVTLFRFEPDRFPSAGQFAGIDSEWARDFGPLTISEGEKTTYASPTYDGRYAAAYVAEALKAEADHRVFPLDGGNFMATSDGICAVAWKKSIDGERDRFVALAKAELEAIGCRTVIVADAMPAEDTGHIDLFAKFVADRTVLLAKPTSDSVWLDPAVSIEVRQCPDGFRGVKDASKCHYRFDRDVSIASEDIELTSVDDFARRVQEPLSAHIGREVDVLEYSQPDLAGHVARTRSAFEASGVSFAFETLPLPPVRVKLLVQRLLDRRGRHLATTARLRHTVRSYVNAQIINDAVFVPSYSNVDPHLQSEAAAVYRRIFPEHRIHQVDMTATVETGGAVHCLTKELH